ncbi:MAG: tRNA epoxyqueuosine(34) reductase QueG [Intestinibacter bartlettii]|uniref:tRNA epoxyqueuosine(34) reductase QueG n=1 Tax=Intestinibacter bartlettii TaxID=261299 RepID=UPI0026F165CC|nr:tRNA epoxyqueuosine(34) reductase QueG [Intestinibacter bartlettii]MDO5011227.1 tRNA epoxyqueuosine(34) reductase QueG [Intestinibacter bartlettii]
MNKDRLLEIYKDFGIDTVGVAPVEPYIELEKILIDRKQKEYLTGMEEEDIQKRINPKLIMEDAKSIIVCAFPYYTGEFNDSNISKYCYGEDYHIVTKEVLNDICLEIAKEIPNFKYEIFADNGPLVDRYLAYLSGIGYFGINNNIITDKYGSYVFIAYIVNNYDFSKDKPLEKDCLKCNKCVEYCPGNAILGNYEIDPRKCLSYITQKKEELSSKEEKLLRENKKVFGCDICQEVCPHNKDISMTNLYQFSSNLTTKIDEDEINEISNKEFKRRFKNKAFSWRGRKIIKRNLDIISNKNKTDF